MVGRSALNLEGRSTKVSDAMYASEIEMGTMAAFPEVGRTRAARTAPETIAAFTNTSYTANTLPL